MQKVKESREGAPAHDIEGQPRNGKIDIGAYAFRPIDSPRRHATRQLPQLGRDRHIIAAANSAGQ